MKISLIIKTLNEEKHIEECISSVIRATNGLDREIILVDSISKDNTVKLAHKYPIKIITLNNKNDARCGIGHQVGYMMSKGELIYVLDGDMITNKNFIKRTIPYFEKDKNLGGITGQMEDIRDERYHTKTTHVLKTQSSKSSEVDSFNGFGIYRRSAIEKIGFLTNPYFYSHEDYDIGFRLKKKGYNLKKIEIPIITHYRHTDKNPISVLVYKFKKKYFLGNGQVLRYYLNNKSILIKHMRKLKIEIVTATWQTGLLLSLLSLIYTNTIFIAYIILSLIAYCGVFIYKKEYKQFIHSIICWNFGGLGLIIGFILPKKDVSGFKPEIKIIK